ncbi:MAG: hypothetical protein CML66_13890 [Rhodobacteraceae bacterium]|nr:hypothetical protein [Paracoccaceae bacterium]MAY48086.1 hypothetical protein [Paracoccaceae bacterium]|tara:strand:+ start:491 stop:769 length:279 start_codon:yes stop_codon:yes gene_type:complete
MSAQISQSTLGTDPFATEGQELAGTMDWIMSEERSLSGPEEMIAVLEGALRLVCDGETHELETGQGALIAEGSVRRLSPRGPALVYRVRYKA